MANIDDLLQELHGALVQELLTKVRSGDATAADLSVARQLLKDHGVNADPDKNKPMRELVDNLPDLPTNIPFQ